ncbi:MAG: radical SAM protein [Ruminococcaceae bacterium]|nr:radical SAM protein [Oscillospiraceae bacterium]
MKHYNIPVFIPHLGCPHNCIFCNQKKITGQANPCTIEDAQQEIERHLAFLPEGEKEISFFGGSFTAIPVKEQEEFLSLAKRYVAEGRVQGIRLSTRPDCVEPQTLERLQRYGVTTVELGVQSFCDEVLQKAGRGHSADCAVLACKRVKEAGFSLGIQLMCGLPEDCLEYDLYSAKLAKELADFVRIYPVLVLWETPLEQLYLEGRYQPLSLEEAVERTARMKEELSPVLVIRTGLCTEDLREEDVADGPLHPAFGELVDAKVYDRQVREWLTGKETRGKTLLIVAPKGEHSKLSGHKKSNLKGWKQDYQFKQIRFLEGDSLHFSIQHE